MDQCREEQQQDIHNNSDEELHIVISFRGSRIKKVLTRKGEMTVEQVKQYVLSSSNLDPPPADMTVSHVKLLYKGKNLTEPNLDVYTMLLQSGGKKKKTYNFIALGISGEEQSRTNQEILEGISRSTRSRLVRDDLSEEGKLELHHRKHLGQQVLAQAASSGSSRNQQLKYGFQRIETLPMLPNQETAKEIFKTLRERLTIEQYKGQKTNGESTEA